MCTHTGFVSVQVHSFFNLHCVHDCVMRYSILYFCCRSILMIIVMILLLMYCVVVIIFSVFLFVYVYVVSHYNYDVYFTDQ